MLFECAGAVFWKVACLHCRAIVMCAFRLVVLRCLAWQARLVLVSLKFVKVGRIFWRHSPVQTLDACRNRVVRSTKQDFDFVASLLCVTGAAL